MTKEERRAYIERALEKDKQRQDVGYRLQQENNRLIQEKKSGKPNFYATAGSFLTNTSQFPSSTSRETYNAQ